MSQLTPNPKQRAAGRIRSAAPALRVPATRDEAAAAMERLALVRAAIAHRTARLDADIATLQAQAAADCEQLVAETHALEEAVRLYCAAHRAELTRDGRSKTVAFGAGEVSWRNRPASLDVFDVEAALAGLRAAGLAACIRSVETVDKPALMRTRFPGLRPANEFPGELPGIRYVAGTEDCIIKTRSA